MRNFAVVVAVLTTLLVELAVSKKCPVCDPAACPPLSAGECLAGSKKDKCDCCNVCSLLEGQSCDKSVSDPCGDGLECRETFSGSSICTCKFDDIVCGTDNKTYSNLCQLMVAAVREQKTNTLNVNFVGPCDPGARIITKPEYVRNRTNANIVLQCEAMGLPTPTMAWTFTRADHQTFSLPGYDNRMVTSSRGGPGKFMITSWLQIEGLQKYHEGDYTCVAFNKHSSNEAKARIKVID